MTVALFAVTASVLIGLASAGGSSDQTVAGGDKAAIEDLHRRDVQATLANDVEQLVALFTDDGVLLAQGSPAVVGKQAFREYLKKQKAQSAAAGMKVLSYAPSIHNLTIHNGWAYEWGDFEAAQQGPDGRRVEFHGKFLRVLERQPDGSWKFSRVMWNASDP